MIYKSLKELERKFLSVGDIIVFKVRGVELTYEVTPTYCQCIGPSEFYCRHRAVFTLLSLTEKQTEKLAGDAYGYNPLHGLWPECKSYDLKALTRFVNRIYKIIEDREGRLEAVQPSKYKVGDIVILRKKYHPGKNSGDYPYGFPEQMLNEAKWIGRTKIVSVHRDGSRGSRPMYEEPYHYWVEGSDYIWTSAMFEGKVEKNLNASTEVVKEYTVEYFIPRKVWVKNHFANTDIKNKQVINLD